MVQIVGTYQLTSQENYEAYLKAIGLKEDAIQKAKDAKAPLVVTALDDSKITVSYGGQENTYIFNQETEQTLMPGVNVKTTATIKGGDTITFKNKAGPGGVDDVRVLKFTDSGATSTSTANGVSGVRHYKRA